MGKLKQIWIGLVGVVPRPGSNTLSGGQAKGAFVNALAFVSDEEEYKIAVQRAASELGLETFEYEDVERFSDRVSKFEVNDTLKSLAEEAESTGSVKFGTFHNYMTTE
jgi:hypothetical protein